LGDAVSGRSSNHIRQSISQTCSCAIYGRLSGNLGFTHDPVIVFEAARLLRDRSDAHFLLSGWGIGFDRLKQMQSEASLPNVTFVDRVDDENLGRSCRRRTSG
jgi:hypothetical protein